MGGSAGEWLDDWLDEHFEFVELAVQMTDVVRACLLAAEEAGFSKSDMEQAAGGDLMKCLSDERDYDTTISDEQTRDA